jgi:hypothetical protein
MDGVMKKFRSRTRMLTAILTIAVATSALADGLPGMRGASDSYAPIYVRGHVGRSVITPYYFGYYPGHYSYNSPGPVFYRLTYYGPHYGCRLWRYNYLYWIC